MDNSLKFKNIEFLRFIFALIIVSLHSKQFIGMFVNEIPYYGKLVYNSHWGHIPVEFFFIISGFFLFIKTDFNQSFWNFAKKKFCRLMPLVFYSTGLYYIASLLTDINYLKYDNIFAMLSLGNCGLTLKYPNNAVIWYVSSLFWGMNFYFYLYKCVNKKIFNLITACIVFFGYSLFIHHSGVNHTHAFYVINRGITRALTGIGVGYFIAMIYSENIAKIKSTILNTAQKVLVGGVELSLFIFIVKNTCLHRLNYNNPLILVLAFIGLFMLFLVKKGYFSQLLENKLSVFGGQFSYTIFMTHFMLCHIWTVTVCKYAKDWVVANSVLNIALFYGVVILFAVFTYYAFEKPVAKFIKKKGLLQ